MRLIPHAQERTRDLLIAHRKIRLQPSQSGISVIFAPHSDRSVSLLETEREHRSPSLVGTHLVFAHGSDKG